MTSIPFNKPWLTGREVDYVQEVLRSGQLSAGGLNTATCERLVRQHTGSPHVLLTHSCTAALELAAILSEVGPGDEVILPSYTFPSTANAFVLRGATPVFVDIRADTLNLDETLVEAAITPRTRAILKPLPRSRENMGSCSSRTRRRPTCPPGRDAPQAPGAILRPFPSTAPRMSAAAREEPYSAMPPALLAAL
jgi:hypothetical protein